MKWDWIFVLVGPCKHTLSNCYALDSFQQPLLTPKLRLLSACSNSITYCLLSLKPPRLSSIKPSRAYPTIRAWIRQRYFIYLLRSTVITRTTGPLSYILASSARMANPQVAQTFRSGTLSGWHRDNRAWTVRSALPCLSAPRKKPAGELGERLA
jgi:hypothetical protein